MQEKYWRACLTFIFTRWMYAIMVNSQNEKAISSHGKVYYKAYLKAFRYNKYIPSKVLYWNTIQAVNELSDIVEYISILTHEVGGGIA